MDHDEISATIIALNTALATLAVLMRKLGAALKAQQDVSNTPSKPVQTPLKDSLNTPSNAARHRLGRPSRIDSDTALRAFIAARINTTTFTALERAVAKAVPADRRIGKSAIHHWWERNVKSIPKPDPDQPRIS